MVIIFLNIHSSKCNNIHTFTKIQFFKTNKIELIIQPEYNKMLPGKYRIAWRVNPSGVTGNGEYLFNLDEVKELVNSLNTRYPDMEHWFEQITTTNRYELGE